MKLNLRGMATRWPKGFHPQKRFYGIAVAVLAATVVISTGFVRKLAGDTPANPSASPIVSTMRPLDNDTIAPLEALDRATEAVAERVIPSVVTITVGGTTKPQAARGPMPQDIPEPFRQFFGPFQMQPQPRGFEAVGTGLIISPDGYIVTNNHVVANASTVSVTLHDNKQYTAKVVGTDEATDLAVIKINATGLPSAAWGDSSQLKPGETVLAIGDPMGMDFSVTRGIVSALNRPRTRGNGMNARGTFIQTDAPINHGNSGGPLVDIHGEVVGINSEMLTSSGASAGIGFSIPSNLVKRTATELIEHGKVVRGYLGIVVENLPPTVADSLGEAGAQGALVNQVNNDSPAARAGIQIYDVVTGFNGQKVTTGTDLQTYAGETAPGSTAKLDVLRHGKTIPITVTLGDLASAGGPSEPEDTASGTSIPKLGITPQALTPDVRGQLRLPSDVNGVVVASVEPGSPAMMAGLSRGDIIEQVNQHRVDSISALQQQLRASPAGKDILLLVYSGDGTAIIPVRPQD